MADVKLKNGFLRISVSLFENLYFRNFSKRELQIISLILRLSYGYHKKTATIKPKTWFTVCGIYQPDINNTLKGLIEKNVIRILKDNVYSLNKNYDEWLVGYPKNFNFEKLNMLKMLQQKEQNTIEKDSKTLSNNIVNYYDESKQNTNDLSKQNTIEKHSKTLSNNIVKHYDQKNEIEQNTIEKHSKTLSKSIVKHYIENAGNETDAGMIEGSKDNKDNKDNNNKYIYIKEETKQETCKNFDPYFNNPIVEDFKKIYQKIFKKNRCYLDAIQINKITEIAADNPEFREALPEIIRKFKEINFSNGIEKPTLNWLINKGNWAGIMRGEYDKYTKSANEVDGWTL